MAEDEPASGLSAKKGVTIDLGNGATAFFEGAVIVDDAPKRRRIEFETAGLHWWAWPLLAAGWLAQTGMIIFFIDRQFGAHSAVHYWVMQRLWLPMLVVFALNLYLPYAYAFLLALSGLAIFFVIHLPHLFTEPTTFAYVALQLVGSWGFCGLMSVLAPRLISDVAMMVRLVRTRPGAEG